MTRTIILLFFLVTISFYSCDKKDQFNMSSLTSDVRVENLIAERVGDSIKIKWIMPEYEHIKGVKIIDEVASIEIEIDDPIVSEYCIKAFPGNNEIKVFVKDIEGNFSEATSVSIQVTDVYVLGRVLGTNIMYWKNGVGVEVEVDALEDDVVNYGIFVDGYDVYTVGTIRNVTNGNRIAVYWKNGEKTELANADRYTVGLGIFVVDGNVYVSGYERDVNTREETIKYWKNGVETSITNPVSTGEIYNNSIVVEDGVVYVAGSENGVFKIWIDGVETILSDDSFAADYGSICVQNGNYYAACHGAILDDPYFGNTVVKYWENGIEKTLGLDYNYKSYTSGIDVNDGNVCIPICEVDYFNNRRYRYLIDGVSQPELTAWNTNTDLGIVSCASNDGDFYIAGEVGNVAIYWKNGERIDLSNSGEKAYSVNDIFVAD